MGQEVGPLFFSRANLQFWNHMGIHVASEGLVPEALVARHMSLQFCCIGIVKRKFGESWGGKTWENSFQPQLDQLVEILFESL